MEKKEMSVFRTGEPNDAFAQYFQGQSYLNMLSTEQVSIGNVTFEPGCRNHWHIHHADKGGGQILLITSGTGYYQEWGKEARTLHPGDIVHIPAGVKHWHGASANSWFQHLAIEVPGENCRTEWCEPVENDCNKTDRIERCEEKFRQLFGAEPVTTEGTDPEFMRILQRFIFGEVFYTGTLDDRIRELITLTVLTVNQTLPQLKAHTKAALHVGCTPAMIRECIYQCAPFIGFPKTLNAIEKMNEAFTEQGISLPLESGETVKDDKRFEEGAAIQEPIYGTKIRERYTWLTGEFAEAVPTFLTELCFGDFYTRTGLDTKIRELLILVLLAALGGAGEQIKSHVSGAMKVGNTKEEIVCALVQAMPYMGIPRLFQALDAVKEIL